LLEQLGLNFGTLTVNVAETRAPGETPEQYVRRVALDKASAGLAQLAGAKDAVVIGADTEVVLDDQVFGKPADGAQAKEMLGRLSGCTHRVLCAVWCLSAERKEGELSVSEVSFAPLTPDQIATYVATGESLDKAGAYAIQGRAAAFIRHLSGSYSGVMGLPLFETASLLRKFGLPG
jgi:septum formation protein